jgi:type II secretory pathway pseudopilin PulG
MKRSFTLIEVLLYMGLMSIFIVVLGRILIAVLDAQTDAQNLSAVEMDSRYVLTRLTYDVRRAQSITTPALGVTGPSLELNIGGVVYTYTTTGNKLQLTVGGQTADLTSYDSTISNFSVTQIGRINGYTTARISFTITSDNETQDYQTTIATRNKIL